MSYSEIDIIRGISQMADGKGKSLLYVGANQRRAHLLRFFAKLKYDIEIIEVFDDNIEFCKRFYAFPIIQGDIRHIKKFTTKFYDVISWIHGPEHIEKNELKNVLKQLENQAKIVLMVGPNGKSVQNEVDGNKYEKHLWSLDKKTFIDLGYNVKLINDDRALIMWKIL